MIGETQSSTRKNNHYYMSISPLKHTHKTILYGFVAHTRIKPFWMVSLHTHM